MSASTLVRCLILGSAIFISQNASALSVSWGALTTSSIASCDATLFTCDINSSEMADGGSNTASANASVIGDPRGLSSASAALSGSAMTPTLGVFAQTGLLENLAQSSASGIQAYTNLDVDRTITLDLSLTTGTVSGNSAVLAYVSVFRASELVFTGDSIDDVLIDPVLLTAEATASLSVIPGLPGITDAMLEFAVDANEDFLIWALLVGSAQSGIADASSTLHIDLLQGSAPLGPQQLDIASLRTSEIPLPASAWLFLSGAGVLGFLGLRRKTSPAS